MSEHDHDPLDELREAAVAAAKLAQDEKTFVEAYEAFRAGDSGRFQSILDEVGIGDRCGLICVYFCAKRCVGTCVRLCPQPPDRPVDAKEVFDFTLAIQKVVKDRRALERLVSIAEREDVRAWQAELKKHELTRYCHQVCRFVCRLRCKRHCRELCKRPAITRISSIPVSGFDAQVFGHGPSIPPFQVPLPDPPAGVGDHPVGGSSWLMGVFNMPTATEYLVEAGPSPAGPWTPIIVPVEGYNTDPPPPYPYPPPSPRLPDGSGWYKVSEIFLSDGGRALPARRRSSTGRHRATASTT